MKQVWNEHHVAFLELANDALDVLNAELWKVAHADERARRAPPFEVGQRGIDHVGEPGAFGRVFDGRGSE